MKENFNASFPLFEKIEVNGEDTHPLYVYLRNHSELFSADKGAAKVIPWNFAKFILDRDGKVIKFAPPTTEPKELRELIEAELAKWFQNKELKKILKVRMNCLTQTLRG